MSDEQRERLLITEQIERVRGYEGRRVRVKSPGTCRVSEI